MSDAYYNEHDPFAAEWLRGLISAGLIAPGYVDERDIRDVQPSDLAGFTRCHFFAGIAGWDLALQLAEWPTDRPLWTGSCPCQPFSSAGKGGGFDDPRHLWPAWFRLIRECRPPTVFGEQVASKAGLAWFDHVAADLEAEAYAVGAADIPAAGVGAWHIRQRLFFVAESSSERAGRRTEAKARSTNARPAGEGQLSPAAWTRGGAGSLADSAGSRSARREDSRGAGAPSSLRYPCGRGEPQRESLACAVALGDGTGERLEGLASGGTETGPVIGAGGSVRAMGDPPGRSGAGVTGVLGTNAQEQGHQGGQPPHAGVPDWTDIIWLPCRDGKLRPAPTEPALFPLAPGLPGRVGLLRGAGNSIVPQAAEVFIRAFLDAE